MKRVLSFSPLVIACLLFSSISGRAGSAPEPQPGARGYLKIYSATEQRITGYDTYSFPHTGYNIYYPDGSLVNYVQNHVGIMDETPNVIVLPAGEYMIKARAQYVGFVRFPVEIKPGHISVVRLEFDPKHPQPPTDATLIHDPEGRVVGWEE